MFNKYNSDNALPHTDANTHNVNDTRVSCPLEHVVCYMLFAHHLSLPFCAPSFLIVCLWIYSLHNTSTLSFAIHPLYYLLSLLFLGVIDCILVGILQYLSCG
eukprot:657550_1